MAIQDILDAGTDPSGEELLAPNARERTAVIRTSDRIQFRGCRRRWGWGSHLRGNLGPTETFGALWFGTGIHYALEDCHSTNIYGHPSKAFKAYVIATSANQRVQLLPPDVLDLIPLGGKMMEYYWDHWLRNRDPFKTFVFNGVPQVEVNAVVEIDLNLFPRWLRDNYDHVLYAATFDRVIIDEEGLLWIVDYKTAKRIETSFFQTDPQVSAYCWLGQHLYGQPIQGLWYHQFRKDVPQPPRVLVRGGISSNKQQLTTHTLYRAALVNLYGPDFNRWPRENIETLNEFAASEGIHSDRYIRRDRIHRNQHAFEAEGTKILMEIEDMLDPTLKLYPNPNRWCPWCPFNAACVNLDDGSDWQYELNIAFKPRPKAIDSWRPFLPPPDHPKLNQPALQAPQSSLATAPL